MNDLALFIVVVLSVNGLVSLGRYVLSLRDAEPIRYVYRWNANEGCYEKVFKLTDRRLK